MLQFSEQRASGNLPYMVTWGLTQEMLDSGAWGIDPKLLAPAKTQTDPIHHDIYWNKLELLIIDSRAICHASAT